MPPPTDTKIDVPFSAAFLALDVLIDNAKEAIRDAALDGRLEEAGQITIRVWRDIPTGKIVCEVNDNGPGIPPGLRKKLGKKPCPSSKNNSHGYGVYLSTYLLMGLHGNLILMPPNHRKGATFELWFPSG
jgi:sensor histidine kinase regulating citrate/malate metabolism